LSREGIFVNARTDASMRLFLLLALVFATAARPLRVGSEYGPDDPWPPVLDAVSDLADRYELDVSDLEDAVAIVSTFRRFRAEADATPAVPSALPYVSDDDPYDPYESDDYFYFYF